MEAFKFYYSSLVLFILGFMFPSSAIAYLGINYGQIANNLPSPSSAVPLVQSLGATKVKIFDANPRVLRAFANTNIELIIGLGNQYLSDMRNPDQALSWVTSNVQAYLPATKITGIAVGNEVFNDPSLSDNLLPAMHNVHNALIKLGLDKLVIVTSPHAINILETSYPPSNGTFRQNLVGYLDGILKFHVETGSPLFLNVYPFFAYKAEPTKIPLNYVLFKPNQGIVDPVTNLHYDNILYAQVDAVYSALASLGYKEIPIHISETGWPSKGDIDEVGATPENAKDYNWNLMKLIAERKGTPMRPTMELNAIIFALFNENMKPGPTSERNYGLFKPDGTRGVDTFPTSSAIKRFHIADLVSFWFMGVIVMVL